MKFCCFFQIFYTVLLASQLTLAVDSFWDHFTSTYFSRNISKQTKCSNKNSLKYVTGNALVDDSYCVGPNNLPYPSLAVSKMFSNWNGGSSRRGRKAKYSSTMEPTLTQQTLLSAYGAANQNNDIDSAHNRHGKLMVVL